MGLTWGELSGEPPPEQTELGGYYLSYSELESSLRHLAVWAIATTHGFRGDGHLRTRDMVQALADEMNFVGITNAITHIIKVRTRTLDTRASKKLRKRWDKIRQQCDKERGRRNSFAHSSLSIEEDLGGAVRVASRTPKTYSAGELRGFAEGIDKLTLDVQGLAECIILVPFE